MKQELVQTERILSIIEKYLTRKKNNNSSYSNRALARDLNLSPSFVSDILKGKKQLPYKHVDSVVGVLDIDQSDAADLKLAYTPEEYIAPTHKKVAKKKIKKHWVLGSRAQMKILSKWYYVSMLDLITCPSFDGDFARALDITNEEANEAVSFLEEEGLIVLNDGKYAKSSLKLHFNSKESKKEFRHYHSRLLDKSKEELLKTEQEDFEKRLIISYSVAMNSKKKDYFKKRLADLMQEMADEMSEGECDQVYHLGLQFYPLSK
jgi:uncharacterized protein (TIGR02147 family)